MIENWTRQRLFRTKLFYMYKKYFFMVENWTRRRLLRTKFLYV